MTWVVSLVPALDDPWSSVTPIRLGRVPIGQPTPDLFALVARDDVPEQRIDLYRTDEYYFRDQAFVWHEWVALGFGERVYLVALRNAKVLTIPLPEYFQDFHPTNEFLIVLSGSGLTRIEPNGTVAWQTDSLAMDGTSVDRIVDGVIHGSGEWDPPGGWRRFAVRLHDGQLIAAAV